MYDFKDARQDPMERALFPSRREINNSITPPIPMPMPQLINPSVSLTHHQNFDARTKCHNFKPQKSTELLLFPPDLCVAPGEMAPSSILTKLCFPLEENTAPQSRGDLCKEVKGFMKPRMVSFRMEPGGCSDGLVCILLASSGILFLVLG